MSDSLEKKNVCYLQSLLPHSSVFGHSGYTIGFCCGWRNWWGYQWGGPPWPGLWPWSSRSCEVFGLERVGTQYRRLHPCHWSQIINRNPRSPSPSSRLGSLHWEAENAVVRLVQLLVGIWPCPSLLAFKLKMVGIPDQRSPIPWPASVGDEAAVHPWVAWEATSVHLRRIQHASSLSTSLARKTQTLTS